MLRNLIRSLDLRHRNNKQLYYAKGFVNDFLPGSIFLNKLRQTLEGVQDFDFSYLQKRVNYYNRLTEQITLSNDSILLSQLKSLKKQSTYYYDSVEYTRYFNPSLKAKFIFGDVLTIPVEPTILKYRPIAGNNPNDVLLKLNKVRLFNYSTDHRRFQNKKNLLIGRAVVKVPARVRFYEQYFNHPMCDLGQINKDKNPQWIKEKLSIDEHLDYKFILCLEGYDIASNLRWVMSSNSLPVMPAPTFASWYMEDTLIPDYHFVQIKADYSDLEERMNYFIDHPEAALQIIRNANAYASQFRNQRSEDLISLLVLEKYFYKTGQLETNHQAMFDTN